MRGDPGAIEAQRAKPRGEGVFRAALRAPREEDLAGEVRRLRELLLRRTDEAERERHLQRAAEDARLASLRGEVRSLGRELEEERAARADEVRRLKAAVLEARSAIGHVLRDRDAARAGEARAVAEAARLQAQRDSAVATARAEVEAEVGTSGEAMAAVVQALEGEQAALRTFAEKCVRETWEVREEVERMARAASARGVGVSARQQPGRDGVPVQAPARARGAARPSGPVGAPAPVSRAGGGRVATSAPKCGPEPRPVPRAIRGPHAPPVLSTAVRMDVGTSPIVQEEFATAGGAGTGSGQALEPPQTPPRTPLRTIPSDLGSIIDKFYDSDVRRRQLKSAEKAGRSGGTSGAPHTGSPRRLELDDVEDEQRAMARSASRSSPAPKAKFPGELFGRAAVLAEAARQEVGTAGKIVGSATPAMQSPSLQGVSPTLAALLKGNPQSAGGWLRYLQGGDSPEEDDKTESKTKTRVTPGTGADPRKSKLGTPKSQRRSTDLSPTKTPSPTPRKQKPTPMSRGSPSKKLNASKKVSPENKPKSQVKKVSPARRSPLLEHNRSIPRAH